MTDSTPLLPAGVHLSDEQLNKLDAFGHELRRMNQRINLVSSETEAEFWKRHTAHSLALATRSFPAGSRVVDWGTGGGLPAVPLAIAFPQVQIIGIDSVRKKVQSCTAIARRLGLDNCSFIHGRAEEVDLHTDYSVSRATAPLGTLWAWHTRVAVPQTAEEKKRQSRQNAWPGGLICLKGGDLSAEIQELKNTAPEVKNRSAGVNRGRGDIAVPTIQTYPLSELFEDSWFEEKVIVQVHSG